MGDRVTSRTAAEFEIEANPTAHVVAHVDGEQQTFNGSWYRGEHTNFIPSKKMLTAPKAFDRFIIKGYQPEQPFIDKETVVTAFGSCFAQNISKWLLERDYNVLGKKLNLDSHIIRFGEGIVNTFAILEQMEWALAGKDLAAGLWFGDKKEVALPNETTRQNTKALLEQTEVLIITLGLSEIWYDRASGRAFWRAVPAENFDPEKHGFKLSTVEENLANLEQIVQLRDRHIPTCRMIFTLSPIPLMATFRPINCISASTVSKAILRIALDSLMSQQRDGVYYFPSYELFKEVYPDPLKDDNRHPRDEYVANAMELFAHAFCSP